MPERSVGGRQGLFAVEAIVSVAAIGLGLVTIVWQDWIEALTGWDPDHGNGSVEWIVVIALLVIGVSVGVLARREWRALRPRLAR